MPRAHMLLVVFLALSCRDQKPGSTAPGGGGGASSGGVEPALRGDWKRTLLTFDENANDALDDAERQARTHLTYGFTALHFDAGGKCRLEKGAKTFGATCRMGEWKGKKAVELEPDPNVDELVARYAVVSATEKELVLKDGVGNKGTIYVYGR